MVTPSEQQRIFLNTLFKKISHLISNFSLKTASYHGKLDKMQQQHLKEPQQIKRTLILSSSLSPLQSTLLSLKVHAPFSCQSLVVTSPLSESISHKRLFKTDSNPEYQSSIATDWLTAHFHKQKRHSFIRGCAFCSGEQLHPFLIKCNYRWHLKDSSRITKKKNANWDRMSVQKAKKKTHLTIKNELYCCTNSITRKEDLVNIASDPKLIGVTKAGDLS